MRTDPDIRRVLLPQLRAERSEALLVQEWGITPYVGYSSGGMIIVDVATVGELVEAWEIKSAADSVKRLPRQVPLYSSLFDRCTLVTAANHLKTARATLPPWWGLVVVLSGGDLITERPAAPNPGPYGTVGLLWVTELQQLAKACGVWAAALEARRAQRRIDYPHATSKPSAPDRYHLSRALEALPVEQVAPLVRAALRARTDWRAPDGTHARREGRRAIRQREAERQQRQREADAKWAARLQSDT